MNVITLIGNLARDPEVKVFDSGKTKATMVVAVNRGKRDGKDLGADFIRCVAWGATAEVASKYLAKGRKVGITGSLRVESYETKENEKRTMTEVVVSRLDFLSSSSGNSGGFSGENNQSGENIEIPEGFEQIGDDEVPF